MSQNKFFFNIFSGLMVLVLGTLAHAENLKVEKGAHGITTIEIDIDAKDLTFVSEDRAFTSVKIPNARTIEEIGSPALPTFSRFILVDALDSYTVSFQALNPISYPHIHVSPVQPDHKENESVRPFQYNQAAYSENQNVKVTVQKPVTIGEETALPVFVTPFERNGDELKLFQKIIIQIQSANPNPEQIHEAAHLSPKRTEFAKIQSELLIEGADHSSFGNLSQASGGRVLVLTDAALLNNAKTYASLHPEKKMVVQVLKTGTKSDAIKTYLTGEYAKGDLDTVVLYGDENHVPYATWEDYQSDSYYSYLKSEQAYSVVAIGRIPAKDSSQARFYNEKLAEFLKNLQPNLSKKVMLVAHNQDYPGEYTLNQETVRKAANPLGLSFTTEYGGLQASNATVLQESKNHYGLVAYRGHGDTQGWYEWGNDQASFSTSSILQLANTGTNLSVFFNIACDTARFEAPVQNMAENLLFLSKQGNENRGAAAVLASTNASGTETNHHFNLHLFEYLQSEKKVNLGHLLSLANNKVALENGGHLDDNERMYVVLGDPLIYLW